MRKMLTCPRGSARPFEFTGSNQICQKSRTSNMKSFVRHKDKPQPPTPTSVLLVLMISLLPCVIASPESALELSSGLRPREEKVKGSWLKWLLIVVIGVVVLVNIISVVWTRYRSKGDRLTKKFEKLSGPKKFSYEDLRIATNSFADDRRLGAGGFGIVYKGHTGDAVVAVKKIASGSLQGIKEYISEVESLTQLRHRNLVHLIGYCHEANEFLLVYEFMSLGSLADHLFGGRSLLTWERRYDIALGLASALRYLQKECNQCVIHRDIKSSNTMLDQEFTAKLGDFGLALLVDHAGRPTTAQVVGTLGYVAPEYWLTGEVTMGSDVYSFGVVLLEILCGRSVTGGQAQEGLVKWVQEQYDQGKLPVDSKLRGRFNEKQARALMIAGLWCAHPDVSSRPSVEEAIAVLNLKEKHPSLPSNLRQSPLKVFVRRFPCKAKRHPLRASNDVNT